ncbi:MAG: DUF928 domain-containing protein [Lyngbya sp. HA4199-MV5]|jgi:hypothetical protein|nr:DUF928 domain-containing protein [Lyngbya sp. HA4199-MV5]
MSYSPSTLAKRFLIYLLTLVFIVSSCLFFSAPAQAGGNFLQYVGRQIVLRFKPPKGPSPNRRAGGFGRGSICPVDVDMPLTALAIEPLADQSQNDLPETSRLNYIGGETTEASPTFWFYVPYTRSKSEGTARFMLLDESKKPVFKNPLALSLTENSGIISVSLPPQTSLQVGKSYFWYFSVICDLDRPSRNPSVNGWIQRVPNEPGTVTGQDFVWYDVLNSLASARRQSPSRIDFQRSWELFMRNSKGLEKFAQKEIQPCCTTENQPGDLVKL